MIRSDDQYDDPTLPAPIVTKVRWIKFIWIVPALAAVACGVYLYQFNQTKGRQITIRFQDVQGVRVSDTTVSVRGVEVGSVSGIELDKNFGQVILHVQLYRSAENLARQNTIFYIDHPNLSSGDLGSVNAFIRGPTIFAIPGDGPETTEFTGMESKPIMQGNGIRLILHSNHVTSLQVNAPVLYRGLQVGTVQDVRLSGDATQVNSTIFVRDRYVPLIRSNSEFWIVSGTGMKGNILSGINLQLGSLQTLLVGGVEFGTPDVPGNPVGDGDLFFLHAESKPEWLEWHPHIEIVSDAPPPTTRSASPMGLTTGR